MLNTERNVTEKCGLRSINCELNPLSRSDGAALFAQGATCVLASVLGPVEVKQQNLKVGQAHVECLFRPKSGTQTVQDKIRESIIKEVCDAALLKEMHPRTMISIQLQELENLSGLQACAINAACMALIAAGVPMKYNFAAVHCIIDKDKELKLDPDEFQSIGHITSFTFVFDSVQQNIVTLQTKGSFTMMQLNEAERLCREASLFIFETYRDILKDFHTRSMMTALTSKKIRKNKNDQKQLKVDSMDED